MPAKQKAGTRKARGSSRVKRTMKGGGLKFWKSKSYKAPPSLSPENALMQGKLQIKPEINKSSKNTINSVVKEWRDGLEKNKAMRIMAEKNAAEKARIADMEEKKQEREKYMNSYYGVGSNSKNYINYV
jgi:hypothetical protein